MSLLSIYFAPTLEPGSCESNECVCTRSARLYTQTGVLADTVGGGPSFSSQHKRI